MVIMPLQPGDPGQIGRFRLAGRLGSGGQGVVFLGEDGSGGRFAVKVPHPQSLADPETKARFARELEIARGAAPAFTARVVEAVLEGGQPYIVSEYVEGPSLRDRVDQRGPLSPDEVHRLATGLASALSAIHQAGIVHRDVKPDNVLLGPDGPRLIDFGIARLPGGTLTSSGQIVGTPLYIPPEVFEGQRVTAAADVFAWGAVVAYAAQGRHAFGGGEVPAIMKRILSGEPDLGGVPEPIRPAVAAALAKQPAVRPSAVDLLVRLVGGLPARPERETQRKEPRSKRRVGALLAAGAAAVMLAGATTAVLLWPRQPTGTAAGQPARATVTVTPELPPMSADPIPDKPGDDDPAAIIGKEVKGPTGPVPPAINENDLRAYYQVPAAEHGRLAKRLSDKGFRPLSLSITDQGYTALWRKVPGPAYVTAHNLSAKGYKDFFGKWTAKGYRQVVAAAHDLPGGPVFAAVMEKREGGFMAYHSMTADVLRRRNTEAVAKGYIPVSLSAHGTAGKVLFNVAWVANTDHLDWTMTIGQDADRYQTEFDRRVKEYIPLTTVDEKGLITAVWTQNNGGWWSNTALPAQRHRDKIKESGGQGYRPVAITAGQVGDRVVYSLTARTES